LVAGGAEEVAGVEVAFAPGFFGGLSQLPVVETRAQAAGDGLVLLGAVVVAEAVVGQTQCFREQPALAVVLVQERRNPGVPIPPCSRIFDSRSWKAINVRTV
jgi:drug/metabolite transporter (DMT)-like permease